MANEIMLPVWDETAGRWLTGPGRSIIDHPWGDQNWDSGFGVLEEAAKLAWWLTEVGRPDVTSVPVQSPGYVPVFIRHQVVVKEEFVFGRLRPTFATRVDPAGVIMDAAAVAELERKIRETPAMERVAFFENAGGIQRFEWVEKMRGWRVTLGNGSWDWLMIDDVVYGLREWLIEKHLTEMYLATPFVRAPSWMVQADLAAAAKQQAEAEAAQDTTAAETTQLDEEVQPADFLDHIDDPAPLVSAEIVEVDLDEEEEPVTSRKLSRAEKKAARRGR